VSSPRKGKGLWRDVADAMVTFGGSGSEKKKTCVGSKRKRLANIGERILFVEGGGGASKKSRDCTDDAGLGAIGMVGRGKEEGVTLRLEKHFGSASQYCFG